MKKVKIEGEHPQEKSVCDYSTILKQLGSINISQHHLIGYSEVSEITLKQLMTHIISPTKFKSRKKEDPATGYYKFFVIDWDGMKKGFMDTIATLESGGISFIAFPSPSHWVKKDEYRMRILVPISGALASSKDGYEAQYLAFLGEMGLPIPDKTAGETKRLFYPPVMKDITQPIWAEQKRTDQKLTKAIKKIKCFNGKKFSLRGIQESMELASRLFPTMYGKDATDGKWARSERDPVYFSPKTKIQHRGKSIGKLKDLIATGKHYRCDCPFKDAHEHSDGEGKDYAFIQGDKIICESNTHGGFIGRMQDTLFGKRL